MIDSRLFNVVLVLMLTTSILGPVLTEHFAPRMLEDVAPAGSGEGGGNRLIQCGLRLCRFGFCSIGITRRQSSNVPYPSRELFPFGAPPIARRTEDGCESRQRQRSRD